MTLRVTEISGGLPPAGRGNAGRFTPLPDGGTPIAMRRFTPCRTGERRAVYPLPDGGTPILECGGLPPCQTGERRAVYPPAGRGNADIGMRRFTPCRTGERRAVYPPAGRGNADLECGGLPPCRTGARRFGMWRFTPLPDGGTPIWIVAVYAGYGNVTATIANVLPK